ncbi:MAG: preprotein translocase subunit SecG [Gammaproteobacteria bacterium]|nr:preprotein translocase subunit SecG [Gammaproteobacteria bacterium]
MWGLLLVVHVLVAVALVGLILLQHGKGADAGAAFGSGASSTVFGASGSSNFLSKTTAVLAAMFFVLSMTLGYMAANRSQPTSIADGIESVVGKSADQLGVEQIEPLQDPAAMTIGVEPEDLPATE